MRCWMKAKPSRQAQLLGQVNEILEELDPPPEWVLFQVEEQAVRGSPRLSRQGTG